MTERSKFEQMVERLINEDKAGAEELFHEIVVEKSRAIYQNIIESEDDEDLDEEEEDDLDEDEDDNRRAFDKADSEPKKKVTLKKAPWDKETNEAEDDDDDDEVSESSDNDDEDLDEMFGLNNMAEEDPSMMGGDATDDMMGDISADDDGEMDPMDGMDNMDDEGSDDAMDVIDDMGDALEKLRAEFQNMIDGTSDDDESNAYSDDEGDEEEEEEEGDEEEDDNPFDDKEEESFAYESRNSESPRGPKSAGEQMREYVEKVQGGDLGSKIGGDNGTNTKSTVATKNDMGGTTANVLRTDTETPTEANKGHLKGQSVFKGNPKTDNAGNINVPGGKAGKSSFKKTEPGHGAEKKGKPETADKGAGSTIKTTVRSK
jgi:hypothetical protein